jgi:hypothetical protein
MDEKETKDQVEEVQAGRSTSLELYWIHLGPEGGKALAATLQRCPRSDVAQPRATTDLGAEGGQAVVAALQHCPELTLAHT